jgi:hypothetical protein
MPLPTVPAPELAKPDPTVSPPLGERACPDPRWAARRAYVLQGVQTFLGTHWVWTFNGSGVASLLPPLPPLLPIPLGPEGAVAYNTLGEYAYRSDGAIPYLDDLGTA